MISNCLTPLWLTLRLDSFFTTMMSYIRCSYISMGDSESNRSKLNSCFNWKPDRCSRREQVHRVQFGQLSYSSRDSTWCSSHSEMQIHILFWWQPKSPPIVRYGTSYCCWSCIKQYRNSSDKSSHSDSLCSCLRFHICGGLKVVQPDWSECITAGKWLTPDSVYLTVCKADILISCHHPESSISLV